MEETNKEPLPVEDSQETVANESTTAIEAATALADRIDAGNKKSEEILKRQEALRAEQMLGGHADAGQQPEPKKVESDKEYADRIMRGDLKDGEGRE